MFEPHKYQPYPQVNIQRTWPNKKIEQSPRWCSVDLRDGNQALPQPLQLTQKLEFFKLLTEIGFKEIEVGFPAAAQIEYNFVRELIEQNLIPADVTIQVLTQIKAEQIQTSCKALRGTKDQIVHMYNSTSPIQREIVFRKSPSEIIDLAVQGVRWVKEYSTQYQTPVILEYSPESFTDTELAFARDICNAVIAAWQPTPERKMIINLPATVERTTPNVYADQLEWMIGQLQRRNSLTLSIHTHNDRGTAVAAAELGLLAGAERVEGTLFGNGERSGNCDLITLALNLYSQGIDLPLDFSRLDRIKERYTQSHRLPVHPRHPYAGDMIFTAYSGSHQDAIHKGLLAYQQQSGRWNVPYIPVDPTDLGQQPDFVKFTSQSGRGGLRYILEKTCACQLQDIPLEFYQQIQLLSETTGQEVTPAVIKHLFLSKYGEIYGLSS